MTRVAPEWIDRAAAAEGVDPALFRRLVQRESAGVTNVVSPAGAIGPAQLMPGTAAELGVDPHDADQNLRGGARYLRRQLDAFGGDRAAALVAYNAGPGNARKWLAAGRDWAALPVPGETRPYVESILAGESGADTLNDDASAAVAASRARRSQSAADARFDALLMEEAARREMLATAPGGAVAKPSAAPQSPPPAAKPPRAGGWAGDLLAGAADVAGSGIVGGAVAAVKEGLSTAAEVVDAAIPPSMPKLRGWDESLAALGVTPPQSLAEVKALIDAIPEPPPPDTVAGGLAKGISQFLTGYVAGGRLLNGVKAPGAVAQSIKSAVQGMISDGAFFDAHDQDLSNLIQSFPALRNPVTAALAVEPDDPDGLARIKRMIDGAVPGVLVDSMAGAIRAVSRWRRAKVAADPISRLEIEKAAAELRGDAARAKLTELLGDPDGEIVLRAKKTPGTADVEVRQPSRPGEHAAAEEVGARLSKEGADAAAAINKRISDILNAEERAAIRAEAVAGVDDGVTLKDWDNVPLLGEKQPIDTTEFDRQLDLIRAGGVPPVKGARRLTTWLVRNGGLKDSGGDLKATMGDAKARPGLINNKRGMNLEDAAQKAWEEGYLGDTGPGAAGIDQFTYNEARPSPDALLDAIRRDVAGEKIYSRYDNEAMTTRDINSALDALDQEMKAAGIDVHRLSNEEVRRRIVEDLEMKPATEADRMAAPPPDTSVSQGSGQVYINWARIDGPDDLKAVMQQLADLDQPAIEAAARGTVKHAATEADAATVDAFGVLMQRRAEGGGTPLSASESLAARRLWAASADKVTELARLAAADPSEGNLFAFRRMLATHELVQRETIAARTETARALDSWKIPAGPARAQIAAIDRVLAESGGADTSRRIAERLTLLADNGMLNELADVAARSAGLKTWDAFLQVWINGLLSGPKTHVANMLGNSSALGMQIGERAVAARLSRLFGDDAAVEIGEAAAQWQGLTGAWREALGKAGKAAWTGESGGIGGLRPEAPPAAALSAEAWNVAADSVPGRALDALDTVVGLPGRALRAEDELFKTFGYRMELNAQAYRRATQEARAGGHDATWIAQRRADLLANPPDDIKMEAIDAALYATFTKPPGAATRSVMKLVHDLPALRVLVPFINTPANILKFAGERSPVAPLLGEWRAMFNAGGASRDIALARMATGTMTMLTVLDLAQAGRISGAGPVDPREKEAKLRTGWKPYSVFDGERWHSYRRTDPIGMTIGIAADLNEFLLNADLSDEAALEETDRVVIAAIASVANNTLSKTYMSGLSSFFAAMNDPLRRGESYADRLAGSLVPAGLGEAARLVDPYQQATSGMLDAMRAKLPGASADLPRARDLWGRPVSFQSGIGTLYDAFSPVYSSQENPEPIDVELKRLRYFPARPNKVVEFQIDRASPRVSVDLRGSPAVYQRYVELAGNAGKDPVFGLGTMDTLNQVVTGKHPLAALYQVQTDDEREDFIRATIADARRRARDQLLTEFPELRVKVTALSEAERRKQWEAGR